MQRSRNRDAGSTTWSGQQAIKPLNSGLVVDGAQVMPVTSARSLGVIIDCHLKMELHVRGVCARANFQLYRIGKIRRYLSEAAARTIVVGLVFSILDNNNSLLLGLPDELIDRLQKVQNSAARLVLRAGKFDHVTPLLKRLHWLPIRSRIHFKVLVLAYRCLHGTAPSYLCNLVKWHCSAREGLRSANLFLLEAKRSRLAGYGDRAFSCAAPRLWNLLPLDIRSAATLLSFRSKLKTHFFDLCFPKS